MGSSPSSGTHNICPREDRIRHYTFLVSTVLLNRSGFASLKLVFQLLKLFGFVFFFKVKFQSKAVSIYKINFPLRKTYRGTRQDPLLFNIYSTETGIMQAMCANIIFAKLVNSG